MTLIDENIKIYEEVIVDYAKFLSSLGVNDDPIKVYEIYRYMIFNKYLSSGSVGSYLPKKVLSIDEKFLKIDNCGCLVLASFATCRHLTDFLRHIYEKLGYVSSQLFVYHPRVSADVYPKIGTLTRVDAQKYVDEAEKDLDVFSDEDITYTKIIGDVKVVVRYKHDPNKPNHTVNILKRTHEERVYILDAMENCLGDIIDENEILMHDQGFTYKYYVYHDVPFTTYYGTNFDIGEYLLNEYDTNIEDDMRKSIEARKLAKELTDEFKEFKIIHQDAYDTVKNNFKRLIK